VKYLRYLSKENVHQTVNFSYASLSEDNIVRKMGTWYSALTIEI